MSVLPCQSLGSCAKQAVSYVSEKSNKTCKKYGIFTVLLLEIISIFLAYILKADFINFWYPFLANNAILILLYKNYCDRKILKYCQRTTVALRFMIAYFTFNSIVLTTGLFVGFYYEIVTYLLLTIAFIILLLTMYNTKK